jgi:hypothetical protein
LFLKRTIKGILLGAIEIYEHMCYHCPYNPDLVNCTLKNEANFPQLSESVEGRGSRSSYLLLITYHL